MTKIIKDKATNLSRRQFIVSTAMAGSGLALGFNLPFATAATKRTAVPGTEVNAWVVVNPDNTCKIRIARSEMGQGTETVSRSSSPRNSSAAGATSRRISLRRARTSRANACGAKWAPAAAAASALRKITCGAVRRRRASCSCRRRPTNGRCRLRN